tara:strand:+ start:617 stop:1675 length:1059 start_codon:yes stop_codon:yes gene_type:complete
MEPQYTWLHIGDHNASSGRTLEWYMKRKNLPKIMEIMAAPITDPELFKREIQRLLESDIQTTLCIGGELKNMTEGKPASNFRYEKDGTLNDNVIDNYHQLFSLYRDMNGGKPIFVTTLPRSWRKYSWFIQEDGLMVRQDQEYRKKALEGDDKTVNDKEDEDFMRFLSANCIEQEQLVKIRGCCKGAKYNTYLADMISFLYQLRANPNDFTDTYSPEFRALDTVKFSEEDQFKIYFNETMSKDGFVFFCPKKTSVNSIYHEFQEAISLKENPTKEKIREHLLLNRIDRWTDFSANDTDDAFTLLMLIHAFNGITGEKKCHDCSEGVYYVPTEDEKIILESLHKSLSHWRSQIE